MRKIRILALLALLSLLLVSCGEDAGDSYLYETGEHTHVYGNRYDVVSVTCIAQGTDIRYCKICHEAVTSTVSVPEEIAARAHAFTDTVVTPTEAGEGYTARQCTLCPYLIERTNVVPPLYALLTGEATATVAPGGVTALMMSDTDTHLLSYLVGADTAVPADLALRLAVGITLTDELNRPDAALTEQSSVIYLGNSYTLREMVFEWLLHGDAEVVRALAAALGDDEASFTARVAARLQRLGARQTAVDPFSGTATATLGDTATLLARALDEPLLVAACGNAVRAQHGLVRINGVRPAFYFSGGTLRGCAMAVENGTYRFLLLFGEDMPSDLENSLF